MQPPTNKPKSVKDVTEQPERVKRGSLRRMVKVRRESKYYYAIRIQKGRWPAFLARQNASVPSLFWFHEDAVAHLKKCRKGGGCKCHKCEPEKTDIVKVRVIWKDSGKTYNTPGDMFRSFEELKRKHSNV
jgi:hypothetical protein